MGQSGLREDGIKIVGGVAFEVRLMKADWEGLEQTVPAGLVAHLQAVDEHEQPILLQNPRDFRCDLPGPPA